MLWNLSAMVYVIKDMFELTVSITYVMERDINIFLGMYCNQSVHQEIWKDVNLVGHMLKSCEARRAF